MALGKCRECGKDVSTEAATCPQCGVSQPARSATPPSQETPTPSGGSPFQRPAPKPPVSQSQSPSQSPTSSSGPLQAHRRPARFTIVHGLMAVGALVLIGLVWYGATIRPNKPTSPTITSSPAPTAPHAKTVGEAVKEDVAAMLPLCREQQEQARQYAWWTKLTANRLDRMVWYVWREVHLVRAQYQASDISAAALREVSNHRAADGGQLSCTWALAYTLTGIVLDGSTPTEEVSHWAAKIREEVPLISKKRDSRSADEYA